MADPGVLRPHSGEAWVGLYVGFQPGHTAREIVIQTRRGFSVQIWAQNRIPNLDVFDRDWVKLAHVGYVQSGQKIPIDTGHDALRLLPGLDQGAARRARKRVVERLALYRYSYS